MRPPDRPTRLSETATSASGERSNRLVRPTRDSTGRSSLDAVKGPTKGKPKFVGYQDNAGTPPITVAKP